MGRTSVWIVLVLCAGGVSAFAQNHDASQTQQTQDVQQLQEKVQQLEQLTQELKARLAELEKAQSGTPQVVNATATTGGQPTPATAAQPTASTPPKDTSPLAAIPVANPRHDYRHGADGPWVGRWG